jgi:hypothetical protein
MGKDGIFLHCLSLSIFFAVSMAKGGVGYQLSMAHGDQVV